MDNVLGLEYSADYSEYYKQRELVDKVNRYAILSSDTEIYIPDRGR